MVKIVRDFVPKTRFLILCDGSCGQLIAGEVDAMVTEEQRASGMAEQLEQQQMGSFLMAAVQKGWKIGFDRQLCPHHVKKEDGEAPRILVPSVGRFNPQTN